MRKQLYLKLDGDLTRGVRVTLTIEEDNHRYSREITGNLPLDASLLPNNTRLKNKLWLFSNVT